MKKTLIIVVAIILVIGLIVVGFMMQNKGSQTSINDSSPINSNLQTNTSLSSGPVGFKIQQAIVENNEDPITKQAVSDHLEITLLNTIDKDISNLSVIYSITDLKTYKNESYSVKLEGFTLKAHDSQTIHFDNENKTNHFWTNKYSLYYLSSNALQFSITINAEGYQAQTISVKKDAGGAEQAD